MYMREGFEGGERSGRRAEGARSWYRGLGIRPCVHRPWYVYNSHSPLTPVTYILFQHLVAAAAVLAIRFLSTLVAGNERMSR